MTQTKEYRAWANMKTRCLNPHRHTWPRYGGRGVKICDRWLNSFEHFLSDMGYAPSPAHSLDRYPDNDGHHEPGNCRWATPTEQNRNQRPHHTGLCIRGHILTWNHAHTRKLCLACYRMRFHRYYIAGKYNERNTQVNERRRQARSVNGAIAAVSVGRWKRQLSKMTMTPANSNAPLSRGKL